MTDAQHHKQGKKEIIITGFGGQGIVLAGIILGKAAAIGEHMDVLCGLTRVALHRHGTGPGTILKNTHHAQGRGFNRPESVESFLESGINLLRLIGVITVQRGIH